MQIGARHHQVVMRFRVVLVQPQRIVAVEIFRVRRAEHAVAAGQAEAPQPLLADDLELLGILRNGDEIVPDDEAGRQHRGDAHTGDHGKPAFQFLVLGLVFDRRVAPELPDAVGHEKDDGDEDDARDPEGNDDRVVDIAPIGGDRCPPPWTQDVEQDRSDPDGEYQKCHYHAKPIPERERKAANDHFSSIVRRSSLPIKHKARRAAFPVSRSFISRLQVV